MLKTSAACAFVSMLVVSTTSSASAATAADLHRLPSPDSCMRRLIDVGDVIDARDRNVTREEILRIAHTSPLDKTLPDDVVATIYDFPRLNKSGLSAYLFWSCHAHAYGVPVLPLSQMEAHVQRCFAKPSSDPCGRAVRNEMLGLPADYDPRPTGITAVGPSKGDIE